MADSISGETARLIVRVRPQVPILVATNSLRVQRQLNLSWGVMPFIIQRARHVEDFIKNAVEYIKKNKLAKKGDKIVVVAGDPVGQESKVNLVEIKEI